MSDIFGTALFTSTCRKIQHSIKRSTSATLILSPPLMSTLMDVQLPEELLLHILTYLDGCPPSERQRRQEPGLQLTDSPYLPLKNSSLVSKRWRRVVLPLLFKYARLDLDADIRRAGGFAYAGSSGPAIDSRVSGGSPPKPSADVDNHGKHGVQDSAESLEDTSIPPLLSANPPSNHTRLTDPVYPTNANIMGRLYRPLSRFLAFIQHQHLADSVEGFVFMTRDLGPERFDRFPHRAGEKDWRYRAAAVFWHHLLCVINPARVVLVASPTTLAALTNCAIDSSGDWAFSDMDFHVLELRQQRNNPMASKLREPIDYDALHYTPHRYPGLARSSLFNLRPWYHVSVNEGSFLKAYGTYEFFERGPPSLVYSIKDCLIPRPIFNPYSRISHTPLSTLRCFTYTAIFPFENHLDFTDLLPQLEELDLQLAPDPQSKILDSRDRVGKAQLDDCWSELLAVYQGVAAILATFTISAASCPRMKRFVCRDMRIRALQEDLDEIFIFMCLPVWAEYEPGVFTRLAVSAEAVGTDPSWQ